MLEPPRRGADATRVLWLLCRLEREAKGAGGGVDFLLGNHEVMVMLGDLRYVGPKELAIAEAHGIGYDRLFDVRRSILGSWLESKPAAIPIGDLAVNTLPFAAHLLLFVREPAGWRRYRIGSGGPPQPF